MKAKLLFCLSVTLILFGLSGCSASASTTALPNVTSPDVVVTQFYQALNDNDLETALTYVADDIECRGHCYLTGKDAFDDFIQTNLDHHDRFELSELRGTNETVVFNYIIYRGESILARGVDAVMKVQDAQIIYFEIK